MSGLLPVWHCVYFVRVDTRIKIGWSSWPEQRAKALRGELLGYLPFDERCNGTLEKKGTQCRHERVVHDLWKHLRIEGRGEWFRQDDELLHWINRLCTRPEVKGFK